MGELISLRIEGPILENNIPLDIALDSLTAFQNIVDKSYLALSKGQRIGKKTREEFRITFTKIEKGSLDVDLNIDMIQAAVIAAQITMPFVTNLTPKEIWNLTKNAFNYLKFVLESINKGKLPTYNQTGDGMLLVNNGDGNITVNQITYNVAKESLCDYQEIAKLTKQGVERVRFTGKTEPDGIEINKSNSNIFSPKTEIVPENIQLTCEIFDFNKHKMGGKIAVPAGQVVPQGEYNFELVGDQDIASYVESMLKTKVELNCLQEISPNPFGTSNILKLQVVNIVK
jgi:hypothetical protein